MPTVTARAEPRKRSSLPSDWWEVARRGVAAESAAAFRIAFGLIAAFGALRFLARGWVDSLYLAPVNHLGYAGFEWVRPLPAPWMHVHMLVLALLGICIYENPGAIANIPAGTTSLVTHGREGRAKVC